MSVRQITFVLKGAHAGKTIKLSKWKFVDGKMTLGLPEKDLAGLATYLRKSYQAFPQGSPELEEDNGERDIHPKAESGSTDEVPSGVQSDGEGSSETSSDERGGADEDQAGD